MRISIVLILCSLGLTTGPFACTDDTALDCSKGVYNGPLTIIDKTGLKNFSGYREITGDLTITCPSCQVIDSLGCLSTAREDLTVSENTSLTMLGLDGLTSVGGNAYFFQNPALEEIDLRLLQIVGGWLTIRNHDSINNIELDQLVAINGSFEISNNEGLANLETPRLSTILGNLVFSDNGALTGFQMPDLRIVPGNVIIDNNQSLSSLDGFSNLIAISSTLQITDNNLLPFCEICELVLHLVGLPSEATYLGNYADSCWTGSALDCNSLGPGSATSMAGR